MILAHKFVLYIMGLGVKNVEFAQQLKVCYFRIGKLCGFAEREGVAGG